ncbi:hypothetical protein GCM10011369_20540 [Neiella marina]|uniref:Sulfotransferase family protein n=1 Tax=Neiella marina TaxID=508461 RepID=A0A8J2U5L0_9GAMM|nr:sulfotransferase family 2 domain-containing protein [Neiella marina]GGA78531.1 hypothetical protein GCM10011369_20540 [Neiella marina]
MDNINALIHIGSPKAGSSALQKYLVTNAIQLRQQGFFYPKHSLDNNGISSGNVLSVYDRLEDGSLVLSRRKIAKLIDDFKGSGCHTLLLSSEAFFQRVIELSRVFTDCKFIAYVRSPLDVFESGYNQLIKRHGQHKFIGLNKKLSINGIELLIRSIEGVGADRFDLRAYAINCFQGGNIINDFFKATGISDCSVQDGAYVNRSYCLEALEAKRWLNSLLLPKKIDDQIDLLLQSYNGPTREYSLLPCDVYERLRQQAITALERLNSVTAIESFDRFIESVKTTPQRKYISQAESRHFALNGFEFIFKENPRLYFCIAEYVSKEVDGASDFFSVSKPNSYLERLYYFFKGRRSPNRDLQSSFLIFLHVPKTAGTSFRSALCSYYGARKVCTDYRGGSQLVSSIIRKYLIEKNDLDGFKSALGRSSYKALSGHFNAERYSGSFRPDMFVSFVREPISRLVSLYLHKKRHNNLSCGLFEFALEPKLHNVQTKLFSGLPWPCFSFVGVTERYTDSLTCINNQLNTKFVELVKNTASNDIKDEVSISDEQLEVLRAKNLDDIALVNSVNQYLDYQLAAQVEGYSFIKGWFSINESGQLEGWLFPKEHMLSVSIEVCSKDESISYIDAEVKRIRDSQSPLNGMRAARLHMQLPETCIGEKIELYVQDTKQPILKLKKGFSGC